MMKRIVIFSPSRFSLYTTTVAELLIRRGVRVEAIIVTTLLNPGRLVREFKRDGKRLVSKVWKKLVLRERAYGEAAYETIVSYRRTERISHRTVEALARTHSLEVISCDTLNDSKVIEALKRIGPELVVFTGGGLIRKPTLEVSGKGVLNCHMGVLPRYRGMDVVEWPLLERRFDEVGVTVHFMDEGVDTGDILRVHPIDVEPDQRIADLRKRFEPVMCRALVEDTLEYLEGTLRPTPQPVEAGKQFFIMHPGLVKVAERNLARKSSEG